MKVVIKVKGMESCASERKIIAALFNIDGVETVAADYVENMITVVCRDGSDENVFKSAVKNAGFEIEE